MTISTDAARVTHVANGSTVLFSFAPIEQLTAANVRVTTVATNGTETVQTLGTDYALTPAGVLFSAPPANGVRVVIQRVVPLLQPDIYSTNAPFPAVVTEKRFDEIVKGIQQINDLVNSRAIVLPLGDAGSSSTVLPTAANRANRFLAFNAAGEPIALGSPNAPLGAVARTGDTMLGDLTLAGPPTAPLHAATKAYVDTEVGSRVAKAGDTMTGLLTLSGAPTAANHAATKAYVDTGDGVRVAKAGDTMTGFLTLHADPTANMHAATKQYVDRGTAGPVTASGSAVDFTGIPSWANHVTVHMFNVVTSAASPRIQLGGTAIETTGYTSIGSTVWTTVGTVSITNAFTLLGGNFSSTYSFRAMIGRIGSTNTWLLDSLGHYVGDGTCLAAGWKTLADPLQTIRVLVTSGSFTGGTIFVEWRR